MTTVRGRIEKARASRAGPSRNRARNLPQPTRPLSWTGRVDQQWGLVDHDRGVGNVAGVTAATMTRNARLRANMDGVCSVVAAASGFSPAST
ncbi:hypothetical protein GCM10017691_63710 [Pseudonocardia petroleophila]